MQLKINDRYSVITVVVQFPESIKPETFQADLNRADVDYEGGSTGFYFQLHRSDLAEAWEDHCATDHLWTDGTPEFIEALLAIDPTPDKFYLNIQ
jgi:hypothetical protein